MWVKLRVLPWTYECDEEGPMKDAYEELCASANENPYSITHCSFVGKCCFDLQSCLGGCECDQVYYNFIAGQWLPPPVYGDEGEQSVLHLVPLAGTRWKMANRYLDSTGASKFESQLVKLFCYRP